LGKDHSDDRAQRGRAKAGQAGYGVVRIETLARGGGREDLGCAGRERHEVSRTGGEEKCWGERKRDDALVRGGW
jgi:hypothetical protein